jgi:methylated-DNA-[protein]-cysteine S-methyltransferase
MNPIKRAFLKTPMGYLEINGTEKGISKIEFLNFKVRITRVPATLRPCVNQLKEYILGKRHNFTIDLDLSGSSFQLRVWNELIKIPYGTTISYLELARRVGDIKALRAVGGANGANPVVIVVPCHRVIGSNGKLVGYGGGIKRKKWLLEHEHAFAQRDLFYGKS